MNAEPSAVIPPPLSEPSPAAAPAKSADPAEPKPEGYLPLGALDQEIREAQARCQQITAARAQCADQLKGLECQEQMALGDLHGKMQLREKWAAPKRPASMPITPPKPAGNGA